MSDSTRSTARALASQRFRARAEECRLEAESSHDEQHRLKLLRLAAEFDRDALRVEWFEAANKA